METEKSEHNSLNNNIEKRYENINAKAKIFKVNDFTTKIYLISNNIYNLSNIFFNI